MGVAETLTAWGTLRARDVVEIARGVGLEVAAAATLLELESYGGKNVWGHDGVSTGGAYQKGGEVTEANYAAYRRALAAGTAGRQGVGPCQLTAADYQDAADRLGGCWRWEVNAKVGFDLLRALQARFGLRDGYVAYNGGTGAIINRATRRNDDAEAYGDKAMAALSRWRDRIGTPTTSTPIGDGIAMASLEDLRTVVDQVVRDHVGWARDQILAALGVSLADLGRAAPAQAELAARRLAQLDVRLARLAPQTGPIDYAELARALLAEAARAHAAAPTDPPAPQ